MTDLEVEKVIGIPDSRQIDRNKGMRFYFIDSQHLIVSSIFIFQRTK